MGLEFGLEQNVLEVGQFYRRGGVGLSIAKLR